MALLLLLRILAAAALLTGNLLAAQETSVEAGKAVLLSCVLPYSVDECQWSWQAINETNTLSLIVKKFRAFGNQTRDCSVRFSSVSLEQEGVWTCGSRSAGQQRFTPSVPITLLVYQPVTFVEVSTTVAAKLDKPIALICKTVEQEVECQWSWQTGLLVNGTSVVVEQFKSDGGDCSIHLESAPIAQEGLWTCRARNVGDRRFTSASATHVTVSTELEFVQLSQDIQVNVGEPVWLRCVVSLPVELCHWSWLPLDNPEAEPLIVKDFSPIDEQKRDCSVRIASVLEEQRGLWACGVRQKEVSQFTVAPPAKLTLLPPVKIHFVETPRDVRVAIGQPATLRCVAASSMADCLWMWHPLNEPEKPGLLVKQFSAFGNHSRDCSAHFKNVMAPQEGHWGCTVRGGPSEALLEAKSPLAKLTTYEYIPVEFTEISKDIQVPLGSPLFLRCVVSIPVEECQWSWKALNNTNETESTVSTFHAYGNNSQDCSLRIKSASEENEGIWTCAAYKNDENMMTQAPPTRVVLLKPESVMVALWNAEKQNVTLACKLSTPKEAVTCHWQHPPDVMINHINQTKWYSVQQENRTGMCSLTLEPQAKDMGQWRCVFTVATQNGAWELASATLILINTAPVPDKMMDWLVGVLGGIVILLSLFLIGIMVCKQGARDKSVLGNPPISVPEQNNKELSRYTETPSKINFQFGETQSKFVDDPDHHLPDPNHIYEQVDRYTSPTTSKCIYENVK